MRVKALFFFVFLTSCFVYGAQEIQVRDSIRVFAGPRENSTILTVLERGDSALMSNKPYGRFYKVSVKRRGKSLIGYVLKEETSRSEIHEVSDRSDGGEAYHRKLAGGLSYAFSYVTQSSLQYTDGDGAPIDISSLSGSESFLGVFVDIPMDLKWSLRLEINLRKTKQTGKGQPDGGTETEIEKKISFFSVGALAKFYFSQQGQFWLGGGAEVAKSSQVTLYYSNSGNVEVAEEDYPTYFMLKAAVGYDLLLFKNFYLIPEVRAHVALNTSPMIIGGDAVLALSYAF